MNVCKCVLTGDQVPPPYPILDVHVPERPLLMFALVPAAVLLPSVFFLHCSPNWIFGEEVGSC